MVDSAMAAYDLDIYEEHDMNVTQEEFVFDSLKNETLAKILMNV